MKNTLIKPFTQTGNIPGKKTIKLSQLDYKNLKNYLTKIFSNVKTDNINAEIKINGMSKEIFYAISTNIIHFTPIKINGDVYINNQKFGTIYLMIILKGSTNTIFVPKDGIFIGKKKYKMYIDNIDIISVIKDNTEPYKQRGFYATTDNIDMMVSDKQQDHNLSEKEVYLQREKENPLVPFKRLEQSNTDFTLSDIRNEEFSDDELEGLIEMETFN